MMSYTMACTSSCSIGGRLIRRMSPWTRISGGRPAERCRSDALFLTAKASSSVMSIYNPTGSGAFGCTVAGHRTQFACQRSAGSPRTIMSHYEKGWQAARERIAAAARASGRGPETVKLLAVSKTFAPEALRAVHALGQRAFGENYVQEALEKRSNLADLSGIEWHLIGTLQSNKARLAAETFDWIAS